MPLRDGSDHHGHAGSRRLTDARYDVRARMTINAAGAVSAM